jgi:hypothetical protein
VPWELGRGNVRAPSELEQAGQRPVAPWELGKETVWAPSELVQGQVGQRPTAGAPSELVQERVER